MKRWMAVTVAALGLALAMQPAALQAQGAAPAKGKTMSVTGTVKSVSGNSLVVTAAGNKEMTFTVDDSTKFIGKGLSTKSREKGKLTATDAVGQNDRVTVTYHDMGGTMHAAQVRITNKAMTTTKK